MTEKDRKTVDDAASGQLKSYNGENIVNKRQGSGAQWYETESGKVVTYLDVLRDKGNPLLR